MHKEFEGMNEQEIQQLSVKEFEEMEERRMQKNVWQVTSTKN